MNFSSGETILTPEYDPFYQDLKLKDRIETSTRSSQRDSIKRQSISYTSRKSINLIGVRKLDNGLSKNRFYSPENFNFSYAYNEKKHSDYEVAKQDETILLLGVNYAYNFSPINFVPLIN